MHVSTRRLRFMSFLFPFPFPFSYSLTYTYILLGSSSSVSDVSAFLRFIPHYCFFPAVLYFLD